MMPRETGAVDADHMLALARRRQQLDEAMEGADAAPGPASTARRRGPAVPWEEVPETNRRLMVQAVTVIGPECFASLDESVVCWRGVNYVRQDAS